MAAKPHDQPDSRDPAPPERPPKLRPPRARRRSTLRCAWADCSRDRPRRASDLRPQAEVVQPRPRHFGPARDEFGRDHVARAHAGHRRRRDRSVVRRDVRARRQFARRDVDRARHPDLCGAAADDRRRGAGRSVQRRSGHLAAHTLLHRHARQLQPALWRFALDHQYRRPSTRSIRRPDPKFRQLSSISSSALRQSFGTHPISLEVFWMLGSRWSSASCCTARCSAFA